MPTGAANSRTVFDSSAVQDSPLVDEWTQLRALLLSPELAAIDSLEDELASLRKRVEDPALRVIDVSEVLSEATVKSREQNNELSSAMGPIVEAQFRATARENPELMAESLFPVLGPAIRKMVTSLFKFDANSSGKPYSIEQIFLIDSQSGLPIVHVVHDDAFAQDADMVSGMLNAIQSYVQDAFSTSSFDNLNTLELGELSVWIEWGPHAVIASVIRGIGPERFRLALQERLENIHQNYATELADYEGDPEVFESAKSELHEFLHSPNLGSSGKPTQLPFHQRMRAGALAVVVGALIIWFGISRVDAYHWQNYVEQLKHTPGIVVIEETRGFGQYSIRGLRDPLAEDPLTVLNNFPINKEAVEVMLDRYQALHPSFTVKRVRSLLNPPETVKLIMKDGKLIIRGMVSSEWFNDAKRLASTLPGVESVQYESSLNIGQD